jgi:hypothetical protein
MPGPDVLPPLAYFQHQIVLIPKQFGYVGSYTRGMLDVEQVQDRAFGQMMYRFTTSVLSGRTVTETQRASVKVPASWWQHLKRTAGERHAEWIRKPHSPWLLFILPLDILTIVPRVYLVPWFLRRHPVRYAEITAEVRFTRDTLYPGADVSLPHDRFGVPVMWESLEIAPMAPDGEPWTLDDYGAPRFVSRHELLGEIYRDTDLINARGAFGGMITPDGVLDWLGQHGVSVDQLVARSAL